jgi:hypothetical protein
MCTKYFADGDVHKYFNPYDSPYDSYINFMNVLDHLHSRCSGYTDMNVSSTEPISDAAENFINAGSIDSSLGDTLQPNPPDLQAAK